MINLVDILLPVFIALAVYFGRSRGTIKQVGSLIGIVVGMVAAAYVYSLLGNLTESSLMRIIILALILIAITFLSYDLFTVAGNYLQKRPAFKNFVGTLYDKIGSGLTIGVTTFIGFWLAVLLLGGALPTSAQSALKDSRILATAQQFLSPPPLISSVGALLQPFSSPNVFASSEPTFDTDSIPITERYQELDRSITATKASVAKITSWGCGSVATGSGTMVAKNLVLTSAHVVAGADRISLENNGISYVANTIWFDPKLDTAVLLTEANLTGTPIKLVTDNLASGTIGAVLGYPDGTYTTDDIVILQTIKADGYDIYQKNKVNREIYVVRSHFAPGDSGGPLIDVRGRLAGIIIGHSTTDGRVGFALSAKQFESAIKTAHSRQDIVSTGPCAGE